MNSNLSKDISFTVNVDTFEDKYIVMRSETHQGKVALVFTVNQAQQLIKLFQNSIQSIQNLTNEKDNTNNTNTITN